MVAEVQREGCRERRGSGCCARRSWAWRGRRARQMGKLGRHSDGGQSDVGREGPASPVAPDSQQPGLLAGRCGRALGGCGAGVGRTQGALWTRAHGGPVLASVPAGGEGPVSPPCWAEHAVRGGGTARTLCTDVAPKPGSGAAAGSSCRARAPRPVQQAEPHCSGGLVLAGLPALSRGWHGGEWEGAWAAWQIPSPCSSQPTGLCT